MKLKVSAQVKWWSNFGSYHMTEIIWHPCYVDHSCVLNSTEKWPILHAARNAIMLLWDSVRHCTTLGILWEEWSIIHLVLFPFYFTFCRIPELPFFLKILFHHFSLNLSHIYISRWFNWYHRNAEELEERAVAWWGLWSAEKCGPSPSFQVPVSVPLHAV